MTSDRRRLRRQNPSSHMSDAWLSALSPSFDKKAFSWDAGKWCVFRHGTLIDEAWARVRRAAADGHLQLAKCSTAVRAPEHAGNHVICVYLPLSQDCNAVMRVREVLRELGSVEEHGYKRDDETVIGVYGTPDEWFYRA